VQRPCRALRRARGGGESICNRSARFSLISRRTVAGAGHYGYGRQGLVSECGQAYRLYLQLHRRSVIVRVARAAWEYHEPDHVVPFVRGHPWRHERQHGVLGDSTPGHCRGAAGEQLLLGACSETVRQSVCRRPLIVIEVGWIHGEGSRCHHEVECVASIEADASRVEKNRVFADMNWAGVSCGCRTGHRPARGVKRKSCARMQVLVVGFEHGDSSRDIAVCVARSRRRVSREVCLDREQSSIGDGGGQRPHGLSRPVRARGIWPERSHGRPVHVRLPVSQGLVVAAA